MTAVVVGRGFSLVVLAALGCGRVSFDALGDGGGNGDGGGGGGDAANDAGVMPPSGAALVLHFDENGGTSTTAEGGVPTGSLTGPVAWLAGIRGSAVQFPSAAAYVDFPPSSALLLSGAMSVSIWYQLDANLINGQCVPMLIHGSPGSGSSALNDIYAVNLIPPNLVMYSEYGTQMANGTGAPSPSATAFFQGAWHHIVTTRDAVGGVQFYLDGGSPVSANTVMPAEDGAAGHLRIGADVESSPCQTLPGSVDEIYIYPRELSASEARALFDAR